MAGEKHLLLTIIGGYTPGTLSAETWAVGVRLALVFGTVDPVGALPNNWSPTANNINRTETNWTITGNWNVNTGTSIFNPDDYLNDQAAPAVAAWAAASPMGTAVKIKELKLSPIGAPTGKLVPAVPYTTGTPCLLTWTSANPQGTFGGGLLPPQVALVATHLTPQIGRRGRGRIYFPGLGVNGLDTSNGTSSTGPAAALAAQQALLSGLTYSSVAALDAHVAPIVTGKPWQQYGRISTVRVGNVFDTQRRRRRSIPETFVSGPV